MKSLRARQSASAGYAVFFAQRFRSALFLCLACVALMLAQAAFASGAHAQTYPTKPLRLIVPYTPGGATDITSRIVARILSQRLGQQVVVDNRPGAGGNIGHDLVAKAAPDGYTFMIAGLSLITNGYFQEGKLPYDPIKDFAPITLAVTMPNVLVVTPSLPVTTVKQLIALARAKPNQLSYASAGNGTSLHLAAELFKFGSRVDMLHIPYKGSAQAVPDVIAGQVQVIFDTLPSALPHVRTGKLRAIAVTAAKRSTVIPELPTVAQGGLPGYDFAAWFGFFAPSKTSAAILATLNRETVAILKLPDVKQRLGALGIDTAGSTQQEFAAVIKKDQAKWAQVFKAGLVGK